MCLQLELALPDVAHQLPDGRGLHQTYPLSEGEPFRLGNGRRVLDEVGVQLRSHQFQVSAFVRSDLVVVGCREYGDHLCMNLDLVKMCF